MVRKSLRGQQLVVALLIGAAAIGAAVELVRPVPAQAQGLGWDNFFRPFPTQRSQPRYEQRVAPADFSRAPASPRRTETPASHILVLGDSMADWLAYGLEDALGETPEFGVTRKHRTYSGLLRYEPRAETPDWAQAAREIIAAEKPNFIVMMVGLNDRQSIRERAPAPAVPGRGAAAQRPAAPAGEPTTQPARPQPQAEPQQNEPPDAENPEQLSIAAPEAPRGTRVAGTHEFRTDKWAELYSKKIDDTIAALKNRGVPVLWVGLPSVRGQRSTSDMVYLNELYRTRAEKNGITFVDVWDGFVDEGGRFALQGPDFEGQTRRLRTADGVHFTKAGARKLAHYVEREIMRLAARGPVAVALPASEPQPQTPAAKTGGSTARPLAGPVMPLTAAANVGEDGLLGGSGARPSPDHVTVTRVLVKGEAVEPPAGRGDDFAWPRRGVAPFGADPVVATTTLPLPVMQGAPAKTVLAPNADAPVTPAAPRRVVQRPQQPAQQQQRPQQQQRGFFFPFFR
jgi:hypothetical protein